jgi:hypothetical protein
MSNQSGTIGRNRGLSIGGQMRRQRSQEWNERHYKSHHSSSEEENECIGRNGGNGTTNGLHVASTIENSNSILAQLIAQSQKFSSKSMKKIIVILFPGNIPKQHHFYCTHIVNSTEMLVISDCQL